MRSHSLLAALAATALLSVSGSLAGCGGDDDPVWECSADSDDPDFIDQIGCDADFDAVASNPASAAIPGARSVKTVIDRLDPEAPNRIYFQNSRRFPIHYDFASTHLSGNGLPIVPLLGQFNTTEYFSPDRRFLLGSVTYYENPGVWCYEIAPYDSASVEMVTTAYDQIVANSFFGADLYFHPTSDAVSSLVADLPDRVKVMTTDELFDGVTYQPLNLGESMGRLIFVSAAELETEFVGYRDIVVLDAIPNDITVTAAIITQEFQTPLSHINVLSQNRGTPNMALRGAFDDAELRALDGAWVHLTVGAFEYSIAEVTQSEADAWWEEHRPDPLGVPDIDLTVTELRDAENILDIEGLGLDAALDAAIPAFGGKASHYAGMPHMGALVKHPKAFAIPVYYYVQFMEQNGFDTRIAALLEDPAFTGDPATRSAALEALQTDIKAAPVDEAFVTALTAKINADFAGNTRMRFRSSTNAEDLEGFTGAGLYTSKTGDPNDPLRPMLDAIREVWSSVWYFRAYEEREYRGIDHLQVAMALLVHNSFPDEDANGVAVTANIFDTAGVEPGFYINVQLGEASVVQPDPGTTTDQFIFYYDYPNQPIVYLGHSNLVAEGETVMNRAQVQALGDGLRTIHDFYAPVYAQAGGFFAMDIEFKLDGPDGEEPGVVIKQCRPYPGWGDVE